MKKFSVITVSYNQGEFIRKAIDSVLEQNYPEFEHIVVDGASTDNTVEILESYPHLKWISEPDRGQSDALNKGFQLASGDIVVWLNSDDWLAPGIFERIEPLFYKADIVLANGCRTDREGKIEEEVKNVERSFFDLLRFWVPYSWLVQPAVFFTRSFLNQQKLFDQSHVDESFYFTMDYELWMRMWSANPQIEYTDEVACYYRIYEENKTGAEGEATQRECSRVFRRYETAKSPHERALSLVVSASNIEEIEGLLSSLPDQTLRTFEVLVALYGEQQNARAQMKAIRERNANCPFHLRSEWFDTAHPQVALLMAAERAYGRLVSLLGPDSKLDSHWVQHIISIFESDWIGVHASLPGQPNLISIGFDRLLEIEIGAELFTFRRAVIDDLGGFEMKEYPLASIRLALFRLLSRGWQMAGGAADANIGGEVFVTGADDYFQSIRDAYLLHYLDTELQEDSFSVVRKKSETLFELPDDMRAQLKGILESVPPKWWELVTCSQKSRIEQVLNNYPSFEPAQKLMKKFSLGV